MRSLLFSFAGAALLLAVATPAYAITCDGNFQVQRNGARIATPYCEDEFLAKVAQQNGMAANAVTIRANPSVKQRVCGFVGDDIRVRDTCAPYRNDGDFRSHRR